MIGNEFASFDGSIESFFDAAAKEQKEKKVALPNRKTWTMQSNGQKSIIYQSRKDFPFNEMRRRLLNCNVLNPSCYPVNSYQCCQLQIQCFKSEQSFDIFNENLRVLNIPTWKCDIRAIWPTVWKKCCTQVWLKVDISSLLHGIELAQARVCPKPAFFVDGSLRRICRSNGKQI